MPNGHSTRLPEPSIIAPLSLQAALALVVTLAGSPAAEDPLSLARLREAVLPAGLAETLRKAEEAFRAGRFAEARAQYEKLLVLRPDARRTIHEQIAYCHLREKNPAKSLEHLQRVLDADPDDAEVRRTMARAAVEAGDLDRAMGLLQGLKEESRRRPDFFFTAGVELRHANRTKEAIACFTQAVTLDPSHASSYYERALAYLQLQMPTESKADLQRAIELAPDSPQADTARRALDQIR